MSEKETLHPREVDKRKAVIIQRFLDDMRALRDHPTYTIGARLIGSSPNEQASIKVLDHCLEDIPRPVRLDIQHIIRDLRKDEP